MDVLEEYFSHHQNINSQIENRLLYRYHNFRSMPAAFTRTDVSEQVAN